jgi:NADPH2:quinone reductase
MFAMVLYPNGSLRMEKREIPKPKPEEVLVKVKRCGVCTSDYLIYKGEVPLSKPVVLGHEFTGVVQEIGKDVTYFKPGDKVVVNPNISCGHCLYCIRGATNLCENGISLGGVSKEIHDGGFQEFVSVPQQNLARLDDKTSFEAGTFVEPLACVIHGVEKLDIFPGASVLILGAGPIGLLLTQFIQLRASSKIIVSEPSSERRKFARKFGADLVIDPTQTDVAKQIKDTYGGADYAIEAVGKLKTIRQALTAVKRGGKVLIFGVPPNNQDFSFNVFNLYFNEIEFKGSYSFTNETFYQSLQLINNNKVLTTKLISHYLPLKDLEKAFRLQEQGQGLKKMVVIDNG